MKRTKISLFLIVIAGIAGVSPVALAAAFYTYQLTVPLAVVHLKNESMPQTEVTCTSDEPPATTVDVQEPTAVQQVDDCVEPLIAHSLADEVVHDSAKEATTTQTTAVQEEVGE